MTNFYIKNTKKFNPIKVSPEFVTKASAFAYKMAFSEEGHHRNFRSGGSIKRNPFQIFENVFSGKLSEYLVHYYLTQKMNLKLSEVDTSILGKGEWDSCDFVVEEKKISIKSCAYFGNLLLLEKADYDEQGNYIHNTSAPDIHILVRIKPDSKKIGKNSTIDSIIEIFCKETWFIDIPGFVTKNDLITQITNNNFLPKGTMINGKVPLDADNFYFETKNLISPLSKISDYL